MNKYKDKRRGAEREEKDGRIKDLHSKANTAREGEKKKRDDGEEETVSLRRAG